MKCWLISFDRRRRQDSQLGATVFIKDSIYTCSRARKLELIYGRIDERGFRDRKIIPDVARSIMTRPFFNSIIVKCTIKLMKHFLFKFGNDVKFAQLHPIKDK